MEPANPRPTMLARGPDGAGTGSSLRRSEADRRGELDLPPKVDADTAVEQIQALLKKDRYLPARELAAEAVERFPDHPRLKQLWRIFDNRGKARIVPGGPEPGTDEEFEWLRHPPEWAYGKWVALVGSEAVAVGDTLKEVAALVRSRKFHKRPLVHRIA